MTPYADFLYFRVSLYAVLPALAQGLLARPSRRGLILAATAGMLVVQYWSPASLGSLGAVRGIWLLAGYALVQWTVARLFLRARRGGRRPWVFRGALALGLLPLVLARWVPAIAPDWPLGFLGISYVTFRALDLLISIEDGLVTDLALPTFAAFLLFFPTISSGPVDRYRRFARDWIRERTRAEFLDDLDQGVHRLFRGFLYKFVLAALVKQHWLDAAAQQAGLAGTVSYMYAYTLYLFFDFAGYSAFAIAFSYLFGIRTPENFNRPFLAPNIRDFWNRWHISLSWWFRDHVYMRFVMASAKGGWFASRHLASHVGFVLSMGLMGLWHGHQLQYILYGLYHAGLLVGHDLFARGTKGRLRWMDHPAGRALAVLVTFHAVAFGFLLFSGRLTASPAGRPA